MFVGLHGKRSLEDAEDVVVGRAGRAQKGAGGQAETDAAGCGVGFEEAQVRRAGDSVRNKICPEART